MPELKARAHNLDAACRRRALPVRRAAARHRTRPRRRCSTDDARALLAAAHAALAALAEWDTTSLDAAVREVAESGGVKLGKLAQPLRAALTGQTTSPGIFDVLVLLGQGESLARIADQMLEPNE